MYCQNCGFEYEGEYHFCPKCGVGIDSRSPKNDAPAARSQEPEDRVKAVRDIMKSLASSTGFLVVIIAYTLVFLIGLITASQGGSSADIAAWEQQYGVSLPGLETAATLATAANHLPSALTVVGLWFTYLMACQRRVDDVPTGGLSLIRGVMIFELVAGCVVVLLVLVGIFSIDLGISGGAVVMARFIAAVVFGGIMALMILYQVKLISTIDGIRQTIQRGEALTHVVSPFVVTMNFIVGGAMVLSCFLSVREWLGDASTFTTPTSLFSSLFGAVAYIGFGVFLKKYQKELKPYRNQFWGFESSR